MVKNDLLKGKVAVVTGASRGIGADIVLSLAASGADVALIARNKTLLEDVAAKVRELGQKAFVLACDLTDFENISTFFSQITAEYPKIDIWVNNAGISENLQPEDIDEERWDNLLDTNLKSVFLWTRQAYMHMQKNGGGRLIHISSIGGQKGAKANGVHYVSSKGGIISMSKGLALTGAPYGILSNTICPGLIATDMAVQLGFSEEYIKTVPLGRLGSGEDIAGAVVYLASPLADYVTGATIDVNGGLYLR